MVATETNNFILLPDGKIKNVDTNKAFLDLGFPSDKFNFGDKNYDEYKARIYTASILVYRAINIKANAISSLPLKFVDDYDKELKVNCNLSKAFGKRKKKLWKTIVKDWNIYGSIFLEPIQKGNAVYFHRLNPSTMYVVRSSKGIEYIEQLIQGQHLAQFSYPDDIVYIYDYDSEDDLIGRSPVSYVFNQVGIELSLEQFTKTYFENGATPSAILSTEQLLRPADQRRYTDNWKENQGGVKNQNSVAVLGGGLKYTPITPTIKDLVIDTIGIANAQKIAQAFGVPLSLLLAVSSKDKVQLEADRESFYRETVIPEFEFIASELSDQAVPFWTDDNEYLEVDLFKVDVLQRVLKDITERSTGMFKSGTATLNESRRIERLPAIIGGEVLFLGGRLIPKDKLQNPTQTNAILEGKPLNQSFDTNPTEPVNPNPSRQAERMRGESPKQRVDQGQTKKTDNIPEYNLKDIQQDLRQWKKKALNKGNDAPFTPNYIPDSYSGFIKRDLLGKTSEDDIKQFFDDKIQLFGDTELLRELNQFDDYFGNIHQYINEYEFIFRQIFFEDGKQELSWRIKQHESLLYLDDYFNNLKFNLIYGLTDVSVKIALAGYQKGEAMSTGETNSSAIKLGFDNIQSIINKTKEKLTNQIEKFIEFTRKTIEDKLAEWITLGGTLGDFIQYMFGESDDKPEGFMVGQLRYLWNKFRELLVAETDTLDHYHNGVLQALSDNNKIPVWLTALDDRVCPFCQVLHGQEGEDIGGGVYAWEHPEQAILITQPAHPHCRCFYAVFEL